VEVVFLEYDSVGVGVVSVVKRVVEFVRWSEVVRDDEDDEDFDEVIDVLVEFRVVLELEYLVDVDLEDVEVRFPDE
jgi:hypothetical protein